MHDHPIRKQFYAFSILISHSSCVFQSSNQSLNANAIINLRFLHATSTPCSAIHFLTRVNSCKSANNEIIIKFMFDRLISFVISPILIFFDG